MNITDNQNFETASDFFWEQMPVNCSDTTKESIQNLMKWAFVSAIVPTGTSLCTKLGGVPYADPSFIYPTDKDGIPPLFIGQVDVSELVGAVFSVQQGILYFFGTIGHDGTGACFGEILVQYGVKSSEMVLVELPKDLEPYGVFEEIPISFTPQLECPDAMSSIANLLEKESPEIFEVLEYHSDGFYPQCAIKIGGYPNQIQNCPLREAEMKSQKLLWYAEPPEYPNPIDPDLWSSINRNAMDWMLLLQVNFCEVSDYYFNLLSNWEEGFNENLTEVPGMYVLVRRSDFERLDFSGVITVFQGT